MENRVYDIISKLLDFHKTEQGISMQKLVFLIYLCDWKNSIEIGSQISNIEWKYLDSEFSKKIITAFKKGEVGENIFSFKSDYSSLNQHELKIINFIGKLSTKLDTDDFIKLVYSTYPMIKSDKNKLLNLPDLAKDYKDNYAYIE